jgi:peptidyl-tRNA hydrolase, PTH1 family
MKLIVGLGNPGNEYKNTRHNMGFSVLEYMEEHKLKEPIAKEGYKGLYLKTNYLGEQVMFLKPQTYMNLSGESVLEVVNFFKIDINDILVVYDDLDLEPGRIRVRRNGSSGGQKGINSIIELLKTQDIKRIRVGIGKSKVIPIVDYVLGKPSPEDQEKINQAIKKASDAIDDFIVNGFEHCNNHFN